MQISRILERSLSEKLFGSKAIVLIGPRQVGKTTLIRNLLKGKEYLFLDGDDITVRNILDKANTEQLRQLIGNHTIVFVDEAQRIANIGITLKIITDQFKEVQLLVSGSSALEINNQTREPLTGRKWEYELFPVSWSEFENEVGVLKSQQLLETRLLYGMYPDVITHLGEEIDILRELTNSYLYKDLLALSTIRKPEVLEKIVKALAHQIGSEVSLNEVAQLVGVDKNTVSNYIDLLEKGYVIFKLPSFSRNLRNEIKRNQKIYFYDTGIRNALISNFSPLNNRNDLGAIWENFLIAERYKKLRYTKSLANAYFWRTAAQQEIDYVEEVGGTLHGYEFKWNPAARLKGIKTFTETYKATVELVHSENFRDFVN